jgi:SH3-like domain-containing protein
MPLRNKTIRQITALLTGIAVAFSLSRAIAAEEVIPQQLPVPRFVTLAAGEVNVRTGPGLRYPVRFVITRDGLPVEIVREFDVWRQIRDVDGDGGWVHKSMLSGKRAAVVTGQVRTALKKPEEGARPVVKLEPGVIAALEECRSRWCEVSVAGYGGWLKREDIWGVYPDEKFEE